MRTARATVILLVCFLAALFSARPTAEGSLGSPPLLPRSDASGFAEPAGEVDWVVRTPVVLADTTITLPGDLTVERRGVLELRGTKLRMAGDTGKERSIVVRSGGRLIARRSAVTRARTTIERAAAAAGYRFRVEAGGSIELFDAEVSGAGWDDRNPGLVVEGGPGAAATFFDTTFSDSWVGLTLRGRPARLLRSRFVSNATAGLVVEAAVVEVADCEMYGQPIGLHGRQGAAAKIDGSTFESNDAGVVVEDAFAIVERSLFVGNDRHAVFDGNGHASVEHSFLLSSGESGIVVARGARVTLRFSDFAMNPVAVMNRNPDLRPEVVASSNWWGAASGSGGVGGGGGDPVTAGVAVVPWCEESCRGRQPTD